MKPAQELTISIKGQQYKLSKFDMPLALEYFAWTKDVLPNPYAHIAEVIGKFPPDLQKQMLAKAEKRADLRGTIHDPEAIALLSTPKGITKAVGLLFRKYHPDLVNETLDAVLANFCDEHGLLAMTEVLNTSTGTPDRTETDVERDFFR